MRRVKRPLCLRRTKLPLVLAGGDQRGNTRQITDRRRRTQRRDSLGKWFREEGYEIGTAESAGDALTRMAENKWDLALLDIKMRGTDGIELQRRLHEMDPDLIVIMMTGYASVET